LPSSASLSLPDHIGNEVALDEVLTRPRPVLLDFFRTLRGPLLILGAGGKMGPTLSVLARRAATAAGRNDLDVIAVSRFSNRAAQEWLAAQGVRSVGADLMDPDQLTGLPDAENIIYMVGLKFGTADNPALTWAMNTLAPAHVCRRYPTSRIVALSSGNVYPLVPVAGGGAREDHPLVPLGEYANSVIGRERIFEYFSRRDSNSMALVRLSYALDLRYGVLVDIALKVWRGELIDVTNGYFNAIWQGDANEAILRLLDLAACPARPVNLTRREVFSVRETALRFGELMGRSPQLTGSEAADATLTDTSLFYERLGEPGTPMDRVMRWTAEWVAAGNALLQKPTHFEVRDGRY
jgi:nucleoside-diphosphate-sugar epimerase